MSNGSGTVFVQQVWAVAADNLPPKQRKELAKILIEYAADNDCDMHNLEDIQVEAEGKRTKRFDRLSLEALLRNDSTWQSSDAPDILYRVQKNIKCMEDFYTTKELIFRDTQNDFWRAEYTIGNTEQQYSSLFGEDDEILCVQVVPMQKQVTVYEVAV